LDRLLPNVNGVPSRFWFPLGLPFLQVDPMAARKKGDLVLYFGYLFPTEARKPPLCPLVKPKMDLYCRGFSHSETRRSACSKIGPCGCPGSSILLAARSTISSISRFHSPFYCRRAMYGFAAELAAPRNKWKRTSTHFGKERRVLLGGRADVLLVYDCF